MSESKDIYKMKEKEDLIKFIIGNEFITSPRLQGLFKTKVDILLLNHKIQVKDKSLVDEFLVEINNNLEKYPKMNTKDVIEILTIIRNNINNFQV